MNDSEAQGNQDEEVSKFGRFDDEECAICTENPQNYKSSAACGHVYCYSCLNKWCWAKSECPTCKEPIREFLCGGGNWKAGMSIDPVNVRQDRIRDLRHHLLDRVMRDADVMEMYNIQLEQERSGGTQCNNPYQFVNEVLREVEDGKLWMNENGNQELLKRVIIATIVSN